MYIFDPFGKVKKGTWIGIKHYKIVSLPPEPMCQLHSANVQNSKPRPPNILGRPKDATSCNFVTLEIVPLIFRFRKISFWSVNPYLKLETEGLNL